MTIVIFTNSLGCGGAERVVANLANHWIEKQREIVLITIEDEGSDFYRLDPRINRIVLNQERKLKGRIGEAAYNFGIVIKLRRILRTLRPNVALSFMVVPNIQLALAGLFLETKLLGAEQIHPPECPSGAIWEYLRKIAYHYLDVVVAPTAETSKWLKDNSFAPEVKTIPQAILWPLRSSEPYLKTSSTCHPNRKLILGVGRLVTQKGFDLLIYAFSSLRHYWEWDLVIIGDGPLRDEIAKLVRLHGLENRVFLPGLSGNIGQIYML
jgi:glycosyltransferase involved in cell wall biosynthesis